MEGAPLRNATASPHLDRYRIHLAHMKMPTERETALLLALEQILSTFVEIAHGDDPAQHVHEMRAADEKAIPLVVSSGEHNPVPNEIDQSSAILPAADGRQEDS